MSYYYEHGNVKSTLYGNVRNASTKWWKSLHVSTNFRLHWLTIDVTGTLAVSLVNKSALRHFYGEENWDTLKLSSS